MRIESVKIEGYSVTITYYENRFEFLSEAKAKGIPLVGTYSVMKHAPHTNPGEYHLHVYDGQNEIFAINKNGTAHDRSHNVRIPNKVHTALQAKFPNWILPADQIIESLDYTLILASITDMDFGQTREEIELISKEILLLKEGRRLNESLDINHDQIKESLEERRRRLNVQLSQMILR